MSSRPALVYLPGLDGTGRLLFEQRRLLEQFDVLAIAYPDPPQPTYPVLAAAAASAMVKRFGRRPAVVLSESFGGAVALNLAANRPELIGELVFVNSFVRYPRRWLIGPAGAIGPSLPARPSPDWSRSLRQRWLLDASVAPEVIARFWSEVEHIKMRTLGRRLKLISTLDARALAERVEIPATVIVSRGDRLVPPSAGETLHRSLRRSRLVRVPGAHAAMLHPGNDASRWIG